MVRLVEFRHRPALLGDVPVLAAFEALGTLAAVALAAGSSFASSFTTATLRARSLGGTTAGLPTVALAVTFEATVLANEVLEFQARTLATTASTSSSALASAVGLPTAYCCQLPDEPS